MLRRCYRGMMVGAMGAMLVAGCSTPHRYGAAPHQSEAPAEAAEPASSKELDKKQVEAHAHYAQGLIYDLDDEPALALKEFSAAAADDPSDEELVMELTRRYVQLKQPEQALEVLMKAVAVPGASGEMYGRLAAVYSRLGKHDQAIQAAQTAIKLSPQSLAGYENLYVIHLDDNKPREALMALDRAAKAPDASAEFLIELGGLYANLERRAPLMKESINSNGLAVLNQAAKLNPPDPRAKMKLADDFNLLNDPTNAAKIYEQLLQSENGIAAMRGDVRSRLAEIYLRDHDSKKAAEQLEAVIQDDPANSQAYYLLGSLAYDEQKLPKAIDYFQKTLLLSDDFEQVYYDLAGAQINVDKPGEALATLNKARAKFTPGFMVEFLTGLAYGKEKDFTNSLKHFMAAELAGRTTEPGRLNRYFYFEAGAAFERTGNVDEAQRYFEKSLQLSPDFAEAMNYLGYMLADRGVKLDRARELIEKAVKLEPKNAAYVDSLGWVFYRLNRLEEALAQEQKAIELSPEPDPTLYDHLGDIYAALKQSDKAREAWQKSLSLETNDQVRKKLDNAGGKKTSNS